MEAMVKNTPQVSPNRWIDTEAKFPQMYDEKSDWFKIFYTPLSYLADQFSRIFENGDFSWNTQLDQLFPTLPSYEQWFSCVKMNCKFSPRRYTIIGDIEYPKNSDHLEKYLKVFEEKKKMKI